MQRKEEHHLGPLESMVNGVFESLDNMQGRIERGEKLLDTVNGLLVDYCYSNCSVKDGVIEYPKEIKIAMDIISLLRDDVGIECFILNDNKKELDRITEKLPIPF